MKNILKNSIITIFIILCLLSNSVYATSPSCSSISNDAETFVSAGEKVYENSNISAETITSPVVPFVQMLMAAGILIIGACIVILGIQWVLSKPSPEAQAKLKGKMVALAVAAAIMFGGFSIWSILVNILSAL